MICGGAVADVDLDEALLHHEVRVVVVEAGVRGAKGEGDPGALTPRPDQVPFRSKVAVASGPTTATVKLFCSGSSALSFFNNTIERPAAALAAALAAADPATVSLDSST